MKNLNKVLAMLVVFTMIVTTVAFAATFSDVADSSSYSKAIKVDADLGLITGYEDGTFKPEGEITRAEFAAIVVRMLGQEAQAKAAASTTSFTDVPANYWAAGYINIATQAGIIKGYGNGKFGPDDLVNYEDALTMVVRALGYEHAIGSAGYPTGYITKAGELGLTSGVNGNVGVAANRGTVAAIAFNALDVPLMLQKGYGTFTQWVAYDGTDDTSKKTVLSEYHDTAKIQGTVNSIKYKTTNASSKDDTVSVTVTNGLKNRFEIGLKSDGTLTNVPVTMNVGASDAANFVGKKVVMFVAYDEFEDECTVASLYEASSVDSIVLSLADIDSVSGTTVKYYNENNKLTTITVADVSDLTKVYYNGIKGAASSWSDILDLSGTVEFSLIGDGSYDYDTTYVTAYSTFVVKSVRAASSSVTSKFANGTRTIYFDPEDTSYKASLVDADGKAMDFKDLEENDVLMLKYVNDGSVDIYDAYIVNNTVSGTVTALSGSSAAGSTDRSVTIDGKDYDVAKNVESKIGKTIKLGDEGTYYLNDNDEIVYFDATLIRSDNYGFVIADDVDTGLSKKYQVQIVGKDNSVTIFDLANKVKVGKYGAYTVNGATVNKYDTVQYDAVDAYNDSIKNYRGVVTYKLNSANEVSTICLADKTSTGDDKYDNLYEFVTNASATYDADRDAFKVGSKYYYITDSTVIFNAGYEKVTSGTPSVFNDDTEVIANNSFEDGQSYIGAYIYDVDENDDTIGAMAFLDPTNTNTFGAANDYAFFITSAGETDDENGDTVTYVKGYRGLAEETLTSSDVTLTTAQGLVGALVYPTYNANGTIKALLTSYANSDNSKVLVNGTLTAVDSDRDYITVAGTEYKVKSDTNIYVYDKVKASSRKPYEVGSDIYFTQAKKTSDPDYTWGIYHDKDMKNCNVTAYVYLVDDDVVDLVYYINSYSN